MIALLDNTVLSNFAPAQRPDLIRLALGEEAATVEEAFSENQAGIRLMRLPASDWTWLPVLQLNEAEQPDYRRLRTFLDAGEAACLAMAAARGYRLLTDDREAREAAIQLRIPISGTLGLLVRLVEQKQLALAEGNELLRRMIVAGYRASVSNLEALLPPSV